VLVETLIAHPTVEAFHIAVLHRLSWLDEIDLDSMSCCPLIEGIAGELRPVVNLDRVWISAALLGEGIEK
jgi:hypothetical protein